jgi:four helix bundle protein
MGDFKNLGVWQKSHSLALDIYQLAGSLRGKVDYSLRSQLLRSALSIPSNIVEGSAKRNDKEFVRYLRISLGSTSELEQHLIFIRDLGALSDKDFEGLCRRLSEIRKMLNGLIDRLDGN